LSFLSNIVNKDSRIAQLVLKEINLKNFLFANMFAPD